MLGPLGLVEMGVPGPYAVHSVSSLGIVGWAPIANLRRWRGEVGHMPCASSHRKLPTSS